MPVMGPLLGAARVILPGPTKRIDATLPLSVVRMLEDRVPRRLRSRFLALAAMAALTEGGEAAGYKLAVKRLLETRLDEPRGG